MSQKNVDAVRRAVDEVNAGEIGPSFDALFASRLDFRDELGELDNRDDLRGYLEGFREALTGLHVDFEQVRDLGDTLLLAINQEGHGAASGIEVGQRFTWVMTFRDGRCIHWHIYADHREALESVGLKE
jgi:ketosteroid isomerase-like protein